MMMKLDTRDANTYYPSPENGRPFFVQCDRKLDRDRYIVDMGIGERNYIELHATPDQIDEIATKLGFIAQDLRRL